MSHLDNQDTAKYNLIEKNGLVEKDEIILKIMNVNINDFGGSDYHREEFKRIYGNRHYIYKWDQLDKSENINKTIESIENHSPDIVVMEEYDLNSKEAITFHAEMKSKGYALEHEMTGLTRPSMTVFYVKESLVHEYISAGHKRNGRAYAVIAEGIIIYGTHVPPKPYDPEFWKELHSFVEKHKLDKFLLVGDFNTINYKNMDELNKLLCNAIDVWSLKNKKKPISNIGDYAIISKGIQADDVEIDSFDNGSTDHPIIIVSIKA